LKKLRYLDLLPEDELKGVLNLVSIAKKKRKIPSPKPVPSEPVLGAGAQPEKPGWWRKFKPKNCCAIDIEKVECPNPTPNVKPKYILKAAEVAVVDFKGNILYHTKIKHHPGSFRVNKFNKTGYNSRSLMNGKDIEIVKSELNDLLNNKLVIGVALENDFASLDLPIGDFDVFDLQWHW